MSNNIEKLTEKQKAYYDEMCSFFKSIRVAVPTGIIYSKTIEMTDEECDLFFNKLNTDTTCNE